MPTQLPHSLFVSGLVLITCTFSKCKSEDKATRTTQQQIDRIQKSMKEFADKSTVYRQFPIEVSFFDGTEDAKIQAAIEKRRIFIKQSGLPDDSNLDEFKKTKSTAYACSLYNSYVSKNPQSPYLKTFRQYGAWLILTRLDLLNKKFANDLEMIYALLSNLVGTNYEGYQLLNYGIHHLYTNGFSKKKIKNLCFDVLQYANKKSDTKQKPDGETNDSRKEKLPPEVEASLKKYNENKKANRQIAIDELQKLLPGL